MAKLTMGTDGAFALQRTIQSELAARGYSSESDPVMAEYITIMFINDKTPEQINNELADLIGPEYESNFTDWLFTETAKVAAPPSIATLPPTEQGLSDSNSNLPEEPPHITNSTRRGGPGTTLLQNALSGVHPPTGPSASRNGPSANLPQSTSAAQKRTASARSPSPSSSSSLPNKARRTDAPTGPRAMMDRSALMDRPLGGTNHNPNGRSLIDRVGPHNNRRGGLGGNNNLSPAQVSHIQAKIDGITGSPGPRHPMNGRGGQPPMPMPAPMNGNNGMNITLQDMMVMNWDMMRQMANTIGMIAPAGSVNNFGFPQQNVGAVTQPQMGGFTPGGAPGFAPGPPMRGGMGRGGAQNRGGMGGGGGRGGQPSQFGAPTRTQPLPAPAPAPALAPAPAAPGPSMTVPDRPGTPSLCKYALKCTNPQCRFSHPSPVATVESGVVLSTEFCPKGKDCKDKHCTLGHVSPSVANGTGHKPALSHVPNVAVAPTTTSTPCKFGLGCTRPGCIFSHPPNFRPSQPHGFRAGHQPASGVACRFGASCTRADCPFQHPKGHVSANMFYKGLGPDAPLVEGYVSPHRSVRFGSDSKGAPPPAKQDREQEKKDEKEVEAVALGNEKVGEKAIGVGA
ncbi:hypothetical protein K439DRAFT_1634039 [Ramaria rubella]|nr:hypothetical protein K439DRAFT_1634039 [Ramaria rubella]